MTETKYATCGFCGKEMHDNGCRRHWYRVNDKLYKAVKQGNDGNEGVCHDCGAKPGEYHHPGCDMERCPVCHAQLITCNCKGNKRALRDCPETELLGMCMDAIDDAYRNDGDVSPETARAIVLDTMQNNRPELESYYEFYGLADLEEKIKDYILKLRRSEDRLTWCKNFLDEQPKLDPVITKRDVITQACELAGLRVSDLEKCFDIGSMSDDQMAYLLMLYLRIDSVKNSFWDAKKLLDKTQKRIHDILSDVCVKEREM